ncbi:hypothetical protein BGZ96_001585 [Linnemannia gamsii]|uniref:Homeobox domain-containing protein n=1 Tax=Linnemannia gamsii TaxID=64522 RepID=A0ABQ7K9G2_9FUNG|nr:hypothetical protein BGZ96_001585 [Linnemannia gamsii]
MTESSSLEHQSPHGELRTAFYNPYDIKRRKRTSRSQFKTLERAFIENPKPNGSTRQQLAQRLSMTPREIQVWFQNRRAKNKQANTAGHQANPNLGTDDQQVEDDLGPEGDLLLGPDESGPIEGDFPGVPPLTLTVESSNTLGEPLTIKRTQATRSESVTSDYTSSVLSIESLAVKADTTHSQDPSEGKGSTLDAELWRRSQMWSVSGAHHPLPNLQSRLAASVDPFSPPLLSALGPTAPQHIDQPRFVDTPVVTRDNLSTGTLQKSQAANSPRRRNSKTITFQGLPSTVPTMPIIHRRPSTLSLLRRMSMPATIHVSSDQPGSIWGGQHPSPSTDDLQQSIHHQRSHPYTITNTSHSSTQPLPFHPPFSPQPHLSRIAPSIDTLTAITASTTAATTATTATMGGTHLSSAVFGSMAFSGDTRGHARTYPLSRRVSIHETSFSSSHQSSKHKAVHSLDGLSSTSTLDGVDHMEFSVAPIEVQSKRRKSVSKHFRSSGGSPMAGIHVFDTSGGIVHADTPSSFSESPTSVNVPSFTFSPPEQQPRSTGNHIVGHTTSTTNPHTQIEGPEVLDSGTGVVWMGGAGAAQQSPLNGEPVNMTDSFTTTENGGNFGASVASSSQQTSSPTMVSVGGLSLVQQPHILAGQGMTPTPSSMATAGEASPLGSLDLLKGRRRSSLKSTPRNKSQSGVRVQFDIQHSSTGPSVSASVGPDSSAPPLQQGSYVVAENISQDTWINMAMQQQRPPAGKISAANLVESLPTALLNPVVQKNSSSSPHIPDASGRSGQATTLPTSPLSMSISAEPEFSNQGSVVYWPTATDLDQVGCSGPDSPALDSALLQDAQHIRRNSCPPGFIECFNKGLQIIPDPSSSSSQSPVNQGDIAVFHLQQELEHRLQLQQQQQQFQQQQLQLHFRQQRQQQLQQQLQQQQYHQQFFFPVQEIQTTSAAPSSSPLTMAPTTNVDTFPRQEQPFGVAFPEGHVAEHGEQGFGLSVPMDSLADPDHETAGSDMDSQEWRRTLPSASGHRLSPTDPYHLPQLQTPRLLAQQQHQIEQLPWSRTRAAYSVRPARSRLSLPVNLQDTCGRRYSEPGSLSGTLTQTVPLFDGDNLSSSTTSTSVFQWQSSQDASSEAKFFANGSHLPPKFEETPLSTSLHPLDASASDGTDLDQSSLLIPDYVSSSHIAVTPALGQHIPVHSFPAAMTASPASSISSSPSPSSSPVASRDIREFPYGNTALSSPRSENGPTTYGGPSPPVWGTPSSVAMAVALSPSIEAPLLMRAHSLDSLMVQPSNMRESPTMSVDPNASLASPRRHSQGPSSSLSAEQGHQTHSPLSQIPRQDFLQTQQSYFPSPILSPPPAPSLPNTFKTPLGVHPLDEHDQHQQQQQHQQQLQHQQRRQQQQQHSLQQGLAWNAALPTIFQSPEPVSPHAIQRQQSDPLSQGSPTIVMPHEGFEQTIDWEQNLAAMNHFAILQQKLPRTRQQQQHQLQLQQQETQQSLHLHSLSTNQQLHLQQLQQQHQQLHQQHQQSQLQQSPQPQLQAPTLQQHQYEQPSQERPQSTLPPLLLAPEPSSGSLTQSFAPEPPSTIPSFKDAKEFEEYKHQQFILEHQRLQQRQELELLNDQKETKFEQENLESQGDFATLQGKLQQQASKSVSTSASVTTMAGLLSGHVAIAAAQAPSLSLSSPELKEF